MSEITLPELVAMKGRGEPIVMVTAYDYPSGRLADAAGVDIVLVGDSAAMTVLGHETTVPATMDEMTMLTRAAARGAIRPLVIADMPFGSFQVSDEEAMRNAIRFVKEAGADAVKLEGAGTMLSRVRALVGAGRVGQAAGGGVVGGHHRDRLPPGLQLDELGQGELARCRGAGRGLAGTGGHRSSSFSVSTTLSIRRVEPTRTAAARTGGSKSATST